MYTSINSSAPQDRETRPLKATSCSTPISLRYTHQPEIPPLVRFGSQGVLGLFLQFPFFHYHPQVSGHFHSWPLINFPRLRNFLNKFYLFFLLLLLLRYSWFTMSCQSPLYSKVTITLNDSVILFYIFFSIMAYHRILNTLPCPKQ